MTDSSLTIKRLIYQSLHRGCKETDFLLGNFATHHLNTLSPNELQTYDNLLKEDDWNIYSWTTGSLECPEEYLELVEKIKKGLGKEGARD